MQTREVLRAAALAVVLVLSACGPDATESAQSESESALANIGPFGLAGKLSGQCMTPGSGTTLTMSACSLVVTSPSSRPEQTFTLSAPRLIHDVAARRYYVGTRLISSEGRCVNNDGSLVACAGLSIDAGYFFSSVGGVPGIGGGAAPIQSVTPSGRGACLVPTSPVSTATCDGSEGQAWSQLPTLRPLAVRDTVVQPGTRLLPLGVTDDGQVIYQDGQDIYAIELRSGAQRALVGQAPAGKSAFVYTSGRAAFVWTNPDYTSPSFGVSPLVIYTAAGGAQVASPASPVGTLATTTSANGRFVVFPANAPDATGKVGDLVYASVDLRQKTTLAAGISMGFATGVCPPEAVFVGSEMLVAAYCEPGATTATLSKWVQGRRVELMNNLSTPPTMSIDPATRRILTIDASATKGVGRPVMVTETGVKTVLADAASNYAFFTGSGQPLYFTGTGMFRGATQVIGPFTNVFGGGFGSTSITSNLYTSPDGRWFLYSANADPNFGLFDLQLVDTTAPAPLTRQLDADLRSVTASGLNPFTTDSVHGVTAKYADPAQGTAAITITDFRTGASRAVSDLAATGGQPMAMNLVVVSDNYTPDATGSAFSTTDIKLVSAADERAVKVATGATLTYLLTSSKRGIIYADSATGLHLASF